jgi:hypothetical protein
MANIILPAVPIISNINNNTNLLIEQAGEINRYSFSNIGFIPPPTTNDNGKFLRVVNGIAIWQFIPSAEEASF